MSLPATPRLRTLPVLALALLVAALATPLVLLPQFMMAEDVAVGESAPFTMRVSPLAHHVATKPGSAITIARGELVTQKIVSPRPSKGQCLLTFALLTMLMIAWSQVLTRQSRCASIRTLVADAGMSLLLVASSVALLLFTNIALLALPVGVVGLLSVQRNSRSCALASAALGVVVVGSLVPASQALLLVFAVQAFVPLLLLGRRASVLVRLRASALASLAGLAIYALLYVASWDSLPTAVGTGLLTWLAAGLGPLVAFVCAVLLEPLYSLWIGELSVHTLRRLEKLSQPILKQLADKAPGSWQHSLAMAKLAEAAGKSIGADTQLLRVGAYYHDIGKLAQPRFFIENLAGGEHGVHDNLSPSDSRDGIFAHIERGVQLGRDAGVPEQVLDFVRSHHGMGLLEYFWTKEQLQGSPGAVAASKATFLYPGTLPHSPETGILCICDAVEGAARALGRPTTRNLQRSVHFIIFGKAAAGQLRNSGLGLEELLAIEYALVGALEVAHAPAAQRPQGSHEISTAPGTTHAKPAQEDLSLHGLQDVRLDSHDRPSNAWKAPASTSSASISKHDAFAPTESISDLGQSDTALAAADITEELPVDESESIGADLSEEESDTSSERPSADDVSTRALSRPGPSPRKAGDRKSEPLLLTALKRSLPPPPPSIPRNTIPLGEEALVEPPLPNELGRSAERADSQDGLKPGEMVIGAPPSTHPARGDSVGEETALCEIPVPQEARRPEDRITEEHLILEPPAGWDATLDQEHDEEHTQTDVTPAEKNQ